MVATDGSRSEYLLELHSALGYILYWVTFCVGLHFVVAICVGQVGLVVLSLVGQVWLGLGLVG